MSVAHEYKKNPDGTRTQLNTWQVNFYYIDKVDGKKKKKHKRNMPTKKAGEQFEAEFRDKHELKPGETVKGSNKKSLTFENLVTEYHETRGEFIREHNWKTKDNIINTKILPYFRKMELKDIDGKIIDNWLKQLKKGPGDGTKYADAYLRTVYNNLSTLFNFAVERGYIEKNPVRGRARFSKKSVNGMDFWTLDEYKKFRKAISENRQSYIAFEILGVNKKRIL